MRQTVEKRRKKGAMYQLHPLAEAGGVGDAPVAAPGGFDGHVRLGAYEGPVFCRG